MKLIGTVFIVVLVFTGVITFVVYISMPYWSFMHLEEKSLYFEIYRAILIGFLIGVLTPIVPHILPAARDKFQTFKDSRIAYSRSKTSVIYLPERLATLSFEEAVLVVQKTHEKLHLAETYKLQLLKHLDWYHTPYFWSEEMYWRIFAIKSLLQAHIDAWPNWGKGERMVILCRLLEGVENKYEEIVKGHSDPITVGGNLNPSKNKKERKLRNSIMENYIRLSTHEKFEAQQTIAPRLI